jgi:rRNA processing protein Gar1
VNLGKVVGVSKTQHIILRGESWQTIKQHPKIGETVYTVEKLKIGYIYDIFGPATKPFLSVKLYDNSPAQLDLYKSEKGSYMYTFQNDPSNRRTQKQRSHRSTRSDQRGRANRPDRTNRSRKRPESKPRPKKSFHRVSYKPE